MAAKPISLCLNVAKYSSLLFGKISSFAWAPAYDCYSSPGSSLYVSPLSPSQTDHQQLLQSFEWLIGAHILKNFYF